MGYTMKTFASTLSQPFAQARFHPHRTAGGHRHHRDLASMLLPFGRPNKGALNQVR
jgi:hypothetical protein